MAKINIIKPTGSVESLNIISAFKAENNTYVILDSEKMGSMGLPIIYVSKYNNKLEKINDANEWQSVKNYLKGIISGTNFEYVKIGDNLNADEAYYTPLTLPQASFDAIKNRYVVKDSVNTNESPSLTSQAPEVMSAPPVSPVMPNVNTASNTNVSVSPVTPSVSASTPQIPQETESVMNLIDDAYKSAPVSPVEQPNSMVTPQPAPEKEQVASPVKESTVNQMPNINPVENNREMNFEQDKETFLKACENMFDALISKYQKELNRLEQKEQSLAQKEIEITDKLRNANEALANAEAREQVANIAHDNAKKVMDLNNFMPTNPNNNTQN